VIEFKRNARGIAAALSLCLICSCTDREDTRSIIGEWHAVAIHLPEGLRSEEGSDRIEMDDYGSGELTIKADSTFKSLLRVRRALQVVRISKLGDVPVTLLEGRTSSDRTGHYRDSSGYLILEQPDFVSSSRYQLLNGVLTTTTTVKGFPIQTIWHLSD
jgi:hypothetical protein